jgi:hypothetical protein
MKLLGKKKLADNIVLFMSNEMSKAEFALLYGNATAVVVQDNFITPMLAELLTVGMDSDVAVLKKITEPYMNKISLFCAAFV